MATRHNHLKSTAWWFICSERSFLRVARISHCFRLLKNSSDFSPAVLDTVKYNFYVDDCLKSVDSEAEAIGLINELIMLLRRGVFELKKWSTNFPTVLSNVSVTNRADSSVSLDLRNKETQHVLGVKWNYADELQIHINMRSKPFTRRGILSVASLVFDPLGMLAPVILVAKIILQDLCRTGIGWDDEVDKPTSCRWKEWLVGLPRLSHVAIRRCLFHVPVDLSLCVMMELHHFADASSQGYGTVSYLRIIDEKGKIYCSFLYAKARLAPLKTVSIPRLELMAATLAAQIDSFLRSELEFLQQQTSTFWTDSMSVLLMLNNTNTCFPVFVANRLAKIEIY